MTSERTLDEPMDMDIYTPAFLNNEDGGLYHTHVEVLRALQDFHWKSGGPDCYCCPNCTMQICNEVRPYCLECNI